MTNREKIDYLKQYKNLDRKINRLIEKKERWRTKAEKITPTISDMPHGGDGENQRELAICEMIDCELEITAMIDGLCDLRGKIQEYIYRTGDNDPQLLVLLVVEK